jgi:hypothetical protein
MPLENHIIVESWTEEDLLELPFSETDGYEYKSSLIREHSHYRSELQHKIVKTACAFWNTGGGILVVGVDDHAQVDGGIPYMMGKQKLRDWVDTVLTGITPVGPYTVRTVKPNEADSKIDKGYVVLVVAFGESLDLPHMASDNRYYVRAGAHSSPANHYLVEAIRARRGLRRPMLRGMLREHPQKNGVVELVVLAINDLPALNVQIGFEPVPVHIQEQFPSGLPLLVPVIDRANPFRIDIALMRRLSYWLGDDPFDIILSYEGVRGTGFSERQELDHHRSISQYEIRMSNGKGVEKTLRKMYKQMSKLNQTLETYMLAPDDDAPPHNGSHGNN